MAGESKTEKATPKKRKDERKKGNVFQSQDIVNAFSILAAFFVLKKLLPYIFHYMENVLRNYFGSIGTVSELTQTIANSTVKDMCVATVVTAGPLMLTCMIVGVVAAGAQTKFMFSKKALKPKWERISPLKGIKRIISLRAVFELVKSIVKATIIGVVIYDFYKDIANDVIKLMSVDLLSGIVFTLKSIYSMIMKLSIAFIAIAILDYLYQWWEYERNMKMTKHEVKEEFKQTEGDPLIHSRIKEAQRKMSQQRMMQEVPQADVIIRNPTHFAIALKYDLDQNNAPVVVAKGQDFTALKIVEIAEKNNVPMLEDRPLARALYKEVEIGWEVPPQYYSAIAEILAWVYSLKKES